MNEEIFKLVEMALTLGRVERGVSHPDGKPETDTDHSVSLAWLACSLAAKYYQELDLGQVAIAATIHDAHEIYAGDTYAPTAGTEGRRHQAELEAAAQARISSELRELSWLPEMIYLYEKQDTPEARFVRLVDKLIPKIVLYLEGNVAERMKIHEASPEVLREFLEYEETLFGGISKFYYPEMDELRTELNALLAEKGGI